MISLAIKKQLNVYQGRDVLSINEELAAGSITMICGPSGVGKTTLLKMIAGFIDPDSGIIRVDGITWVDTALKISLSPQKRGVGFVFQDYALFPNMNVQQHLEYATDDGAWIKELLSLGQLEAFIKHKPAHLSGGQQQRLAILRALANKPKVLLMDEPFSALDQKMKTALITNLSSVFMQLSMTVLIVTHNAGELAEMADRSILIGENSFPA